MAEMDLDHHFRTVQIPIEAGVVVLEAAVREEDDGEGVTIRIIAQTDDQTNVPDDVRIIQANP